MAMNEHPSTSGSVNTDTGLFYETVHEDQHERLSSERRFSVMVSIPFETPPVSDIDSTQEPPNRNTDDDIQDTLRNDINDADTQEIE